LPNKNTKSKVSQVGIEEVVRNPKGSRGRRLGPCYVNAAPWPAELFGRINQRQKGCGWAGSENIPALQCTTQVCCISLSRELP